MQRLDSNARKLALLYAVLENPESDYKIHLAQFKRALTVANYWKDSMQRIFGLFAKDDQTKNENTIIERLRIKGRTKRELQQGLTRQMNAKQFNEALDALIKAERVSSVGGKLSYSKMLCKLCSCYAPICITPKPALSLYYMYNIIIYYASMQDRVCF